MKEIGEIKELYQKDYGFPSIKTLISNEPMKHKKEIIAYLKNGKVIAAIAEKARDVLTGEFIPIEWLDMSDGEYVWQTNIIYYVEKYNLKLPDDFVKHVLSQLKK